MVTDPAPRPLCIPPDLRVPVTAGVCTAHALCSGAGGKAAPWSHLCSAARSSVRQVFAGRLLILMPGLMQQPPVSGLCTASNAETESPGPVAPPVCASHTWTSQSHVALHTVPTDPHKSPVWPGPSAHQPDASPQVYGVPAMLFSPRGDRPGLTVYVSLGAAPRQGWPLKVIGHITIT